MESYRLRGSNGPWTGPYKANSHPLRRRRHTTTGAGFSQAPNGVMIQVGVT